MAQIEANAPRSAALLLTRSRGAALEAEHYGAIAVMDASNNPIFLLGDVDRPFFPRSAVKLFHALPFLASGAAAHYGCSRAEIVLAAASHAGEDDMRLALAAWLKRLALPPDALACGAEAPLSSLIRAHLVASGQNPDVLHNNNAGKHLAALTDCLHHGEDVAAYYAPHHPAQIRLMAALRACSGLELSHMPQAVDNCGMVAVATPLRALALGMARLARGAGLAPEMAEAATTLRAAITSAPDYLAGAQRLVTQIIRLSAGRIIAKGGSEGVFVALDQRNGYGFALKINDGSSEAASAAMVELLAYFDCLSPDVAQVLRRKARSFLKAPAPNREQVLEFPFLAALGERHPRPQSTALALPLGEKIIRIHKTNYSRIEHVNLPEAALQQLALRLDQGLEALSAFLSKPIPQHITLRIIAKPGRSRVELRTGRILVSRFNLPHKTALIHELAHIMLGESPTSPLLTEGMAVYLQSRFGAEGDESFPNQGQDLHELAKMVQIATALQDDFPVNATPEEDSAARRDAYICAGSFVRFLVERDGMEAVLALYHPKTEAIQELQVLLKNGEKDWKQFLGLN